MSVVSLLSPSQTAALRNALANNYQIIVAESWQLVEAVIQSKAVSAVIFDPSCDPCTGVFNAERLIKKYSSVPFIAYVAVNEPSVKAVARLARVGLQEVVLVAHDDSPQSIREKVDAVSLSSLASVFLQELRPHLAALPSRTAQTVENLFQMPHRYTAAHDLAWASGITMSSLYRTFRGAGLGSPKRFLIAARVLRGYKYLLEPAFSVENVAAKACYTSPRAFVRHVRQVYGLGPSGLRRTLSYDQALGRLLGWVIDPPPTGQPRSKRMEVQMFPLVVSNPGKKPVGSEPDRLPTRTFQIRPQRCVSEDVAHG
jgi:AraC-like DNA-binding protein